MDSIDILYQRFIDSNGVSIDTRTIGNNQIFFAISGDRFDGHQFIEQAFENGCSWVVIDNGEYADLPQTILVDNTIQALQELALTYRSTFDIPILGITGSNGKTTTKELICAVLSRKFRVHATRGNLNNHLGVPLTLLSMPRETEIAIIEMGANHTGEIQDLCEIARPNAGLVTNIGKAHIGEFGSFENIARTKLSLLHFVDEHEGVIFQNNDDPNISKVKFSNSDHVVTYSTQKILMPDSQSVFVQFDEQQFMNQGQVIQGNNRFELNSQLPGIHNQMNICAALATGLFWKVNWPDSLKAIAAYVPQNNRSQIIQIQGNQIILDAYNANPDSMSVAIKEVLRVPNERKVFILGDMLELGDYALEEHRQILDLIPKTYYDRVYVVGSLFPFREGIHFYPDWRALQQQLDWSLIEDSIVLIKGSRSIALENLVSDFL